MKFALGSGIKHAVLKHRNLKHFVILLISFVEPKQRIYPNFGKREGKGKVYDEDADTNQFTGGGQSTEEIEESKG